MIFAEPVPQAYISEDDARIEKSDKRVDLLAIRDNEYLIGVDKKVSFLPKQDVVKVQVISQKNNPSNLSPLNTIWNIYH